MGFCEAKEHVLRDFLFCVEKETIPPLGQYLPDYVKQGGSVSSEDYGLLPITATALGWVATSSECLTDGMIELRCKYEELVPDEFGGHTERGWRELGVIGFDVLEGVVLDVLAIEKTTRRVDWAEPRLECIDWERVLIHAVVDFGRYCKAKQVRLQPADQCPPSAEIEADPTRLDAFRAELKARHDDNARASGFDYDKALNRFVFDL